MKMRAKIIVRQSDRDGSYDEIKVDEPPIKGAKSISHAIPQTFHRTTYKDKRPVAVINDKGEPEIVYYETVRFLTDNFVESKWKSYGSDHYYDEAITTWYRMVEVNNWFIDIETFEDYKMILEMIALDEIRYFSKENGDYEIVMDI